MWSRAACCFLALVAAGCGSESGGPAATDAHQTVDVSPDAGSAADTSPGPADTAQADSGSLPDAVNPDLGPAADLGPAPDTGSAGEYGFSWRVPETHDVTCDGPMGEQSLSDKDTDWLCTYDYDGVSGVVYFQATLTGCAVPGLSAVPVFDTRAWLSVDGAVSELAEAVYDHGGNHANDFAEFKRDGQTLRYFHSSFGFGWRKCQPMDCLQVFDGAGNSIEDGCTMDRTLPQVCVPIEADGTHASLVDSFALCQGDPNRS